MLKEPFEKLHPSQGAQVLSRLPNPAARAAFQSRMTLLGIVTLGLVLGFARPLLDLGRFAWHSDLYSHIFLIPIISLYLIWVERRSLVPNARLDWLAMAAPLVVGLLVGKHIFKFNPVLLLGGCAGARSTTAGLGAVQEAA